MFFCKYYRNVSLMNTFETPHLHGPRDAEDVTEVMSICWCKVASRGWLVGEKLEMLYRFAASTMQSFATAMNKPIDVIEP